METYGLSIVSGWISYYITLHLHIFYLSAVRYIYHVLSEVSVENKKIVSAPDSFSQVVSEKHSVNRKLSAWQVPHTYL